MFSFIRVRRARTIVEQATVSLEAGLTALAPAERSATAAIANAMLLSASHRWGKSILEAPQTLPAKTAADIVFELAAVHSDIVAGHLQPLSHRGVEDVSMAQAMRQARACELVLATIGAGLAPDGRTVVRNAWKLLHASRGSANDGVVLLMQYANHAKSSPFPSIPGFKIDRGKAVQLATSIPPFLRAKKPVKTQAKAPLRRETTR